MLRVTAGHDIEYPLRGAGTAVGYYLQDGQEPPGVWAGKAAEAMGLTGLVDPEEYRNLFGKLIAPTGERLYSGRPPRYAADSAGKEEEADAAVAAVAALDEFATPAEQRRTRAKVLGSTGAAVPFYDLTFSATKSVSLLQASFAAIAAAARKRGDTATADEFEAKVKAIDDAAVETAAQVVATRRCTESTFENFTLSTSDCPSESADVHRFPLRVAVLTVTAVLAARGRGPGARREEDGNKQVPKISLALQ